MIDHFTVSVTDVKASQKFYERVLAPLGYSVKMSFGQMVGFGDERKPYLWLRQAPVGTTPQHIAFSARSRAAVDAFHVAALAAGAQDDGNPGIRGDYHPNYYAAFVVDPYNGHPIEAVCHAPLEAVKAVKPKKKVAAARAVTKKKSVGAKKKKR